MSENIKQNAKKTETKRGRFISRKPKKRLSHAKNKNLPVEQVLHLQRTIGNRALNRLIRSGAIQAKLTVGKPDSIYEKEADSVADRVMSMPDKSPVQRETAGEEEKEGVQTKPLAEQITPLIRRQAEEEEKPAQAKLLQRQEGEEEKEAQTKIQRQAEEEEKSAQTKLLQRQEGEEEKEAQTKLQRQAEEEEKSAQTKLLQRQEGEEEKEAQPKLQRQAEEEEKQAQPKAAQGGTPEVISNIDSNINEMKGGGQPLSESTRSFFEPRFGADFSQVRIHNNSKAANTAQAINAKAFTTGKDIVFNSGQYSPGTSSGKRLLAHELTHVVQQKFRKKSIQSGSQFVVSGIFLSKIEARGNNRNNRQRGFNRVISAFREFSINFPRLQRHDIDRVTEIASREARRIRNIRRRYFRLNRYDRKWERDVIMGAVRQLYSDYHNNPGDFRHLRYETISRLSNTLIRVYRLY